MSTGNAGGAFTKERETPWKKARGIAAVTRAWLREEGEETFALDRSLDASPGEYAPLPSALSENLRTALGRRGICELYAHQARSFELVSSGRDVVIATPTASGKSLCYHVPVLDALARDPMARAIYLFPTKALSRDQEDSLRALMRDADLASGAITYDGDTPGDARRVARERSAVLITNPDMLHSGILPHHPKWQRLFANLRYVVIDELHSYRGVFGSHLANVLRRLARVAAFHGSSPTFVFASATIGNPKEHASRMIGRDVELVAESGAPEGPKRVMVYNPPLVNQELGIRRSYLKCAVSLACDLVRADVSTLVFGQSRNTVEVMLKYLRDRLTREKIDPNTIHAYRGGYLPDTRRRIEAGLRSGEIKCVVATNALELGIDIGSLDAVICAGYPGNVAALWQRFGRGGRRKTESLSVLVTSSAPLDQYVAGDPSYIVGAPIEQARIDPDNVEILIQHIKCAAFELPFAEGDAFGNVPPDAVGDALEFLATNETLNAGTDAQGRRLFHWASDAYPASHVSLRSASWDNFVIIELPFDKTIAEMDWRSTHTMLHEQAIYQHEGEQYQVERLDYENHKAFVRKVAPDYYTTALTHTEVDVLEVEDEAVIESSWAPSEGAAPPRPVECDSTGPPSPSIGFAAPVPLRGTAKLPMHPVSFGSGEVSVREKVVGYKKIKYHTHENVGYGDVYLPEMQMHTSGFWIVFPEALVTSLGVPRPVVIDALRGLASALHTVASAGLMIDPRDLGRTLGDRSNPAAPPGRGGAGPGFDPTIFLWDHIAGGIGLAPRLFVERDALLRRARTLVHGCACDDGCPACIGPAIGIAPDGRTIASELGTRRRALLLTLLEAAGIEPLH